MFVQFTQPPFKYVAFLSYSHKDKVWGDWLHSALEAYKVPMDLADRSTTFSGQVPQKLRPIFRDRFDLAAAPSLSNTIDTALRESRFLILLCSPASAKSRYVNDEVRLFKALGRADRILPMIVDGEPHDPARECFPDALKYKVDEQGHLTQEPDTEPIAADARIEGDGRDLAKMKLIAGLLGIGLDEVRKREAIAERRRRRVLAAVAGSMTVLAAGAVVAAGFAYTQKLIADEQRTTAEQRLDVTLEAITKFTTEVSFLANEHGIPYKRLRDILAGPDTTLNQLVKAGTRSPKLKRRQLDLLLTFAEISDDEDNWADMEKRLAGADALLRDLAADAMTDVGKSEIEVATAEVHRYRALAYRGLQRNDEALAEFSKSLTAIRVAATLGMSTDASTEIANALIQYGEQCILMAQLDDAQAAFEESLQLGRVIFNAGGPKAFDIEITTSMLGTSRDAKGAVERFGHKMRRPFNDSLLALARLNLQRNQSDQALGYFTQTIDLNERLFKESKFGYAIVYGLSNALIGSAKIHAARGEVQIAKRHLVRNREALEQVHKDYPTFFQPLDYLSRTRFYTGQILDTMGERDQALAEFIEGREVNRKVIARAPDRASGFNNWYNLEIARLSAQTGAPERVKKDAGGKDDLDVDFPTAAPAPAATVGKSPGP